jgi:cytosine/adenosine deaminase-related metal-dependent hydrolase
MPGLICTHTHLYGIALRGAALNIKPSTDFLQNLQRIWWPVDLQMDNEDAYATALVSYMETVLTYVGRASAVIAVKVLTENPVSGVRRHATTTFFTMVRVDRERNPVPMPEYIPKSEGEKKRMEEAVESVRKG